MEVSNWMGTASAFGGGCGSGEVATGPALFRRSSEPPLDSIPSLGDLKSAIDLLFVKSVSETDMSSNFFLEAASNASAMCLDVSRLTLKSEHN